MEGKTSQGVLDYDLGEEWNYVIKQQAGPVIVYAGLSNFIDMRSIICS